MDYNVLCLVCLLLAFTSAFSTPPEVLAEDAGGSCEHGIATFEDVTNGYADTEHMQNGHSGWIKGFADLSQVLSFEGCFDTSIPLTQMKHEGVNQRYNLYYCSDVCKDQGYSYIGLKEETCYCLLADERDVLSVANCDDSCTKTTISFMCSKYVGVYRLAGNIKPVGHQQCLYIFRPSPQSVNVQYGTASCHTVSGISIHGFICNYKVPCNKSSKFHYTCLENEFNHAWTQAYDACEEKGGTLISPAYSNYFIHLLPGVNKFYWIGGFRAIAPVDKPTGEDSCLAVTKIDDHYLLASDYCQTSKRSVCLTRNSNTNPVTEGGLTTKQSDTSGTGNRKEKSDQVTIIIAVTLAILVVLAGVLCVLYAWRRHRKDTNVNRNTLLRHENDFTNTNTDNAVIVVDRDNMLADETQLREATRREVKEAPIKPERHTLRRKKQSTLSYENFQLIPNAETNTVEIVTRSSEPSLADDQYDHVDLKQSRNHGKVNAIQSGNDIHIYSHTANASNEDNYDTTLPRTLTRSSSRDYNVTYVSKNANVEYNSVSDVTKGTKAPSYVNKASEIENEDMHETVRPDNDRVVYSVIVKPAKPGVSTSELEKPKGTPDETSKGDNRHQLQVLKSDLACAEYEPESEYFYIDDDRLTTDTTGGDSTRHEYSDIDYDAIGADGKTLADHCKNEAKNKSKEQSDTLYEDINHID